MAGAELIHHPLPAHAMAARLPQVITVTDLAFELLPGHFDPRFRAYARLAHRLAARRAAQVICISETTAADVRRLWGVAPGRTTVALLGPGQELTPLGPVRPRHFLYVGDAEPRKNLPALLAAYARYRERSGGEPLPLVLAGGATAGAPGVSVVARPDAVRLAELCAGAAALVHPALHEGFGLTPLEAMRFGVPVLAAPVSGVVEVADAAVRYADPHDPETFAAAMAELAGDAALRERLAAAGRRRAEAFTWARCARAHQDAYSVALSR